MIKPTLLFIFVFVLTKNISCHERDALYIWNVGQGSWASFVSNTDCIHFDMGGERPPLTKIKLLCKKKNNTVYISHSDWDHINYIKWSKTHLKNICLYKLPIEKMTTWKKNTLQAIPLCSHLHLNNVIEISTQNIHASNSNALSRIFLLKIRNHYVLIPGDSDTSAEKIWSKKLAPFKNQIRYLILGHHGSYTSTSLILLKNLPHLKLAFSSARRKKYGHPHSQVFNRLKRIGIPVIRTETWNHIKF